MHRPPQLPPFGDVVIGERARAAFGEEVRVVEVYHCDGEDAGAWVGVEVVNSCPMGCGWRIGGYYVEREREPALHGLDFPSLYFFNRGHLAPYNSLLLPLNIPPFPGILAKTTPEQKEKIQTYRHCTSSASPPPAAPVYTWAAHHAPRTRNPDRYAARPASRRSGAAPRCSVPSTCRRAPTRSHRVGSRFLVPW